MKARKKQKKKSPSSKKLKYRRPQIKRTIIWAKTMIERSSSPESSGVFFMTLGLILLALLTIPNTEFRSDSP